MDFQRVGGRVWQRLQGAVETRAESADDTGSHARFFQERRDPLAARCLSVGAGYSANPQRLRWPAVELVRELAGLLLQPPHRGVRRLPFGPPFKTRLLPDDSGRAATQRVRDVRAAIGTFAGIGEEGHAGSRAAAVGG